MNEKNARIAELVSGAVQNTGEDAVQSLLALVEKVEQEAKAFQQAAERFIALVESKTVALRQEAEQFSTDFRKNVTIMSERSVEHVENCSRVMDVMQDLRVALFNEAPKPVRHVDSVATAAVSDAINPHPRIVESYDPDKYER